MTRLFNRGTRRSFKGLLPMDSTDAYFWANREAVNQARIDRKAAKIKERTNGQN